MFGEVALYICLDSHDLPFQSFGSSNWDAGGFDCIAAASLLMNHTWPLGFDVERCVLNSTTTTHARTNEGVQLSAEIKMQ